MSKDLPLESEHRRRRESAVSSVAGAASQPGVLYCLPYPGVCRAVLQTLEAIAEYGVPCQMTDRGNHGEFTHFFAVCIKNVIRHNAMRRPLYQQQQARRTKKRIRLGRGTGLRTPGPEVAPLKLCWRERKMKNPRFHLISG